MHPTATDEYIASLFGSHGEVLKVVKTMSHSEHGQGLHCSGHVVMSNEHDAQVWPILMLVHDVECHASNSPELYHTCCVAGCGAALEWQGEMPGDDQSNCCHYQEDIRQVRMVHT